jgi:hypothetical protein
MPEESKRSARAEEGEAERLDRELLELLNELRVVMPGVQVLFGFLLTVPFQQRFSEIDDVQRLLYFVTLLLTGASAIMLMGPSAFHRLTFRHGQKPYLVRLGTRQTIAGMALLALAMTGAVVLLTSVLFDAATTIMTGAISLVLFSWMWGGLGLLARRRSAPEW